MLARISLAFLILCLVIPGSSVKYGNAAHAQSRPKGNSSVRRYSCPMHPEVTSSRPSKCPKCGMRLRLIPRAETIDGAAPIPSPPATGDLPAISAAQIPDVRVYDQDGNSHNFYRDLVRDKTVAINFIFTTCTGVCPPMTATFRRVQENLSQRNSGI